MRAAGARLRRVDGLRPLLVLPVVALLWWRPVAEGPTLCPFALLTGHACPLCGCTRAASALLRGEVGLAWELHPLVVVAAPLLLVAWVWWWGVRSGRWAPLPARWVHPVAIGVGALLLGTWLLRLTTGTLPPV